MKLPKPLYESIAAWLADSDDPSLLKADGYTSEEVNAHLLGQAGKILGALHDWHHEAPASQEVSA